MATSYKLFLDNWGLMSWRLWYLSFGVLTLFVPEAGKTVVKRLWPLPNLGCTPEYKLALWLSWSRWPRACDTRNNYQLIPSTSCTDVLLIEPFVYCPSDVVLLRCYRLYQLAFSSLPLFMQIPFRAFQPKLDWIALRRIFSSALSSKMGWKQRFTWSIFCQWTTGVAPGQFNTNIYRSVFLGVEEG